MKKGIALLMALVLILSATAALASDTNAYEYVKKLVTNPYSRNITSSDASYSQFTKARKALENKSSAKSFSPLENGIERSNDGMSGAVAFAVRLEADNIYLFGSDKVNKGIVWRNQKSDYAMLYYACMVCAKYDEISAKLSPGSTFYILISLEEGNDDDFLIADSTEAEHWLQTTINVFDK